jgi:hypothetical protein
LFTAAAADNIFESLYVKKSAFYHPLIIIDLGHIAAAMVMKDANNQVVFLQSTL